MTRDAMHSADSTDTRARRSVETAKDDTDRGGAPRTLARRACDACRARRRKCYFASGPPKSPAVIPERSRAQCYDCERLGLRCSFLIPTRTRGPKRRKPLPYDENHTHRDEEHDISHSAVYSTDTEWHSPQQGEDANSSSHSPGVGLADPRGSLVHERVSKAAAPYGSPRGHGSRLRTDELCSREVLNIIMNDYLDRIYPLVPVVHRPTFRAQLASYYDVENDEFFSLVIALVALTVGLLPSRFPYYQSLAPEVGSRFNTRTAMINFCTERCMRLRDSAYWDKVSQRKWAVCYALSVGCFQTGQTNRSRMLEVEALQVGRLLGIHRISDYEGLNCIETQLRKKAFWLIFYTAAHAWHQCCGREERLSFFDPWKLQESTFDALMPLEVDDEQIFEHEIRENTSIPSPACARTPEDKEINTRFNLAIGFNIHTMVFFKSARIAFTPGNGDWEQRVPPEIRLAQLRQLLDEVRYMLDDAPVPMQQWALYSDGSSPAIIHDSESVPEISDSPVEAGDENARALPGQIQIMRANLHGTHLWVQSVLLDRIDAILQEQVQRSGSHSHSDSPVEALKASWLEREDLCRQTLHLLHSLSYSHQEPNGLYFAYKIRDIGVALLNCPFDTEHPSARRAAGYIQEFARALSRLDRSEMVNISSLRSWVDTDREKVAP